MKLLVSTEVRPEMCLKLKDIKEAVSLYRTKAEVIGRTHHPIVRSRGVEIKGAGCDDEGFMLGVITRGAIKEAVDYYLSKGCKDITIQGGFDGADSLRAFYEGCYDTYVSEWSVPLVEDGYWNLQLTGSAC